MGNPKLLSYETIVRDKAGYIIVKPKPQGISLSFCVGRYTLMYRLFFVAQMPVTVE